MVGHVHEDGSIQLCPDRTRQHMRILTTPLSPNSRASRQRRRRSEGISMGNFPAIAGTGSIPGFPAHVGRHPLGGGVQGFARIWIHLEPSRIKIKRLSEFRI